MSLTPQTRSAEATQAAMWEGTVSGLMTLVPSTGAVYLAMKNPRFLARTNMQSRTALAIMPALFMFAWTAEEKLTHKMKEIAQETEHTQETVRWAEQRHQALTENAPDVSKAQTDANLAAMYRKSVEESGVRIVPGNELAFHHRAQNYVAENPLKSLIAAAVPSVALIFWGNSGKEHLEFSVKLLHTRVFGQFATLSLLLGVMGFKEYMDQAGKFITEAEADARVEEMRRVRESLLQRLEYENQKAQKQHDKLVQAHNEVLEEKRHKRQTPTAHSPVVTVAATSSKQ